MRASRNSVGFGGRPDRKASPYPVRSFRIRVKSDLIRMDTLTREQRSERMSRIRGADTKPEMAVRRLVHAMGYRYRLHRGDLPGRPDMVFARRRKVIFVHGCFWHRHPAPNCPLARLPKSRLDFWRPKLEANRERDLRNEEELRAQGWDALVIWECQLRQRARLEEEIRGSCNDAICRAFRRGGWPRYRCQPSGI